MLHVILTFCIPYCKVSRSEKKLYKVCKICEQLYKVCGSCQ